MEHVYSLDIVPCRLSFDRLAQGSKALLERGDRVLALELGAHACNECLVLLFGSIHANCRCFPVVYNVGPLIHGVSVGIGIRIDRVVGVHEEELDPVEKAGVLLGVITVIYGLHAVEQLLYLGKHRSEHA